MKQFLSFSNAIHPQNYLLTPPEQFFFLTSQYAPLQLFSRQYHETLLVSPHLAVSARQKLLNLSFSSLSLPLLLHPAFPLPSALTSDSFNPPPTISHFHTQWRTTRSSSYTFYPESPFSDTIDPQVTILVHYPPPSPALCIFQKFCHLLLLYRLPTVLFLRYFTEPSWRQPFQSAYTNQGSVPSLHFLLSPSFLFLACCFLLTSPDLVVTLQILCPHVPTHPTQREAQLAHPVPIIFSRIAPDCFSSKVNWLNSSYRHVSPSLSVKSL